MTASQAISNFEALLAESQPRIYAFIYSLVGNAEFAVEVFQETNLVLVQKAADFDHSRPFIPWAFGIAKNQIRAAVQKSKRERMVFGEQAMKIVEEIVIERMPEYSEKQTALRGCLQQLPDRQRKLIQQRYENNLPLDKIATKTEQTPSRLAVTFFRIRKALADCISKRLRGHK